MHRVSDGAAGKALHYRFVHCPPQFSRFSSLYMGIAASCGLKSIIIGIIIHVHVRLCSHTASVSHVSHLPTTLVVHPFDPLICLTEFFLARHVHELSFLMGVYNIRNHLCSHAAPVGLIFAAFSKKMSGILMFNFFRFPPVAVVKPLTQSPAAISVCASDRFAFSSVSAKH